ncbi:MAG: T9SS type A sorting domain-containing protein [Flavobacterium sp.]|nr:T9SS type A sorting domain-containing protein [Flavobacterium sp.]
MRTTFTLLFIFVGNLIFSQNYSMNFDGTDDFVEISHAPEFIQNNITIEAWVKIQDLTEIRPILSKYNTNASQVSYSLSVRDNGKIQFVVYQSLTAFRSLRTNTSPLTLNQWHHIAATFDLATQVSKIYVDGNNIASTFDTPLATLTSIYNSTIPVNIGSTTLVAGNRYYFMGSIDEVRFWNIARSQIDIQSFMNTELTGNESNLVSYWKLDDTNFTCDVSDCNTNENHGTRKGNNGVNNLPQYSSSIPNLIDVSCGVTLADCALSNQSFSTLTSTIYPNPTNGKITLSFEKTHQQIQIEIVTIFGTKVFDEKFSNLNQVELEFKGNSGVYILKVKSDLGEESIQKIIKN